MTFSGAVARTDMPPTSPASRTTRYVVLLVVGVLLAGLGLVLSGAAAGLAATVFRPGSQGYVSSPTERYAVDGYAITSEKLEVVLDQGQPSTGASRITASVLLRATSGTPGQDIFVGVGRQADVARYLADVEHSELAAVRFGPFMPSYQTSPGSRSPARPAVQDFWAVSAQGSGTQQIESELRTGNWVMVIMNADGSSPVAVDLQAGLRSNVFAPVALGSLVGGLALLAGGVVMLLAGASGLGRGLLVVEDATPALSSPAMASPLARSALPGSPAAQPLRAYPARLTGELDPNLSRWLWLVKWILAIPHYLVLAFLWCAFLVTTLMAGCAVLITSRYPRGLFAFNVGVLRWTWRVGFYAYAALGTDRYPPFTLARTDYPADFEVDYPERLSRGLVLVKSWLLAIPHLILVGLFSANLPYWWAMSDVWSANSRGTAGISVLGLLVVVAGFFLLITRIYPTALFDLVLGLSRWQYRVITYVALMRDEYPPFQLDQGGHDVGSVDPPSPVIKPEPERIGV